MMVLLPAGNSKTVPLSLAPPLDVVPNRLPLLSSSRPAWGKVPVDWSKDARMRIVPLPAGSSNTVPSPLAPPFCVVPNRLPLLSSIRLPYGKIGLALLNDARAVRVLGTLRSSSSHTSKHVCRGRRFRMVVALRRAHARAKNRTQEGSIAEGISVFSKGKAVPNAKKTKHRAVLSRLAQNRERGRKRRTSAQRTQARGSIRTH